MRSMSQSNYQQRSPPHHDNGGTPPSAMNALYGYNTSPRRQHPQKQGSTSRDKGEKSKKSSPFKDRFKLPNFSKLLDRAFGDDSRKTYQQYSHSTMQNAPVRNLPRRTMSHSAPHSYSSQSHTHFGTSKRYSSSGVAPKDRSLPDLPGGPTSNGSSSGGQRWNLCQCEPYQGETLSPKNRRTPVPCPKPAPSPRYSIHRYPLGMHNTHDDVTGKWYSSIYRISRKERTRKKYQSQQIHTLYNYLMREKLIKWQCWKCGYRWNWD